MLSEMQIKINKMIQSEGKKNQQLHQPKEEDERTNIINIKTQIENLTSSFMKSFNANNDAHF